MTKIRQYCHLCITVYYLHSLCQEIYGKSKEKENNDEKDEEDFNKFY